MKTQKELKNCWLKAIRCALSITCIECTQKYNKKVVKKC
jgi:hypothetical protein